MKLIIVGLLLVGVLYLATRQPEPQKSPGNSASNAIFDMGLTSVLAFGQKLLAPSKTPGLAESKAAADYAVANGLPVSQTQGNGLAEPNWLDGSSLVSA